MMKLAILLGAFAVLCTLVEIAYAGNSWAGANSYYLWACNDTYRQNVMKIMNTADLKVLRIFILSTQGEGSIPGCDQVPDVENPVGVWDDSILSYVDDLMWDAYNYGIKLNIALHDRWSLGCWRTDAYVYKFNIPTADCSTNASHNDPQIFYNDATAVQDYQNRINHILNHVNPHFNQPWKNIQQAIFAFEIENESQGLSSATNTNWPCIISSYIASQGINSNITITSGGAFCGNNPMLPSTLASCPDLDVLTIHNYNSPANLQTQVNQFQQAAAAAGKRWLVQEFGVTQNTANRAQVYKDWIDCAFTDATPWLFWELGSDTGNDDFAVWTSQTSTWNMVAGNAKYAAQQNSQQNWPEIWGN